MNKSKKMFLHELLDRLMVFKHAIRLLVLCVILPQITILSLVGCKIEPELLLPAETLNRLHIELVTDTTLRTPYTHYPAPSNYEFRHFATSSDSSDSLSEQTIESTTMFSASFNRDAAIGRHRLLAWSNIDSDDGTQVVTIQEKNGRATASTTIDPDGISMRDTTAGDSMGMPTIRHAPEMFYGGEACNVDILPSGTTYDSNQDLADSVVVTNVLVKLCPRVYCLRLEVVLAGNDGHITGTPGQTVLTSMARSVDIATGRTLREPCGVYFTSKMNRHATRADNKVSNDTIVGLLTTFGLCDMESYKAENKNIFSSSRDDLQNYLFFTLTFNNGVSKTYRTNVTDIVRNHNPQGLVRVVIDANSIKTPENPDPGHSGGAEGFHPTVDDYDDVVHDFTM